MRRNSARLMGAVARSGLGTALPVLLFALATFAASNAALAKPTGWQSESELARSGASAWSGYGDSGYVAAPAKSRKLAKSKSKALKAYSSSYGWEPAKAKGKSKKAGKSKKKYAALDTGAMIDTAPSKSLTGGGVRWVASSSCLNGTLVSVVGSVAANFGRVTVSSTCRSKSRNAKVGGAKRSHHLTGNAVDFRVHGGNVRAVYAYLRGHGSLGGVKHYGGGLFHIDTGPRRSW